MFNEILFLIHILTILVLTLIATKFKKEGLFALVSIFAILANLFVIKQINLFGFCVTCSDVFIIGASLSLNLIQDLYDKKTALRAIYFSLFSLILYVILTQIHILYMPAVCDYSQTSFMTILGIMPRIIAASIFCYFISQNIDTYLYGYLKKIERLNFIVRNYISLSISQFIDTVLFSMLGLWGSVENIGQIIIFSYIVKMACALIIIPCVKIAMKKWITR